jgi:hypothetical protein
MIDRKKLTIIDAATYMPAPTGVLDWQPGDRVRRRMRKPRKPSLISVAKQAAKAGIPVTRYEVSDDKITIITTGKATADDALSADDELAQWRRKKGHANQG